ncbi:coiled-coil domain-containing protein [Endozoicomonas numazuensis]|nr:hypothetical protein [Endozoicomonas numazuensis]
MDKWQKKLSQKSVVLVHGSQKKELKPICRKLKDTYPTFEFTHGNGLLLVCFGQEQTARVQSLCNRGSNDSSNRVLHDVYRRLGSACYEGWLSQTSKARQKQLNDKIIQQQEKLLSVDSEKTALLAQLKEAEKQRIHIEENLSSLADEKTSFEQQLSSVKNEAHRSQQKIETLSSNIEQLKQQDSKNRAEKKALEDSVSTRFDELAELTKLLHQSDQDKIALEKDQQKLKADLSQTLQSAKQDKASLESTYQETKAELSQAHKAIEQLKTNKNKKPEDSTKIDGEKDLVITKLQENNKLLEEDQAAAARIIEDLKKENQKLERSLNERFDELATLTKILEEKSQISTPLKSEDASIKLNNKQSVSFSFNRLKPISRLSKKQKKDYEFLKESEYFSAKWYLSEYPEVGRSEKEALMHFILVGAGKGYSPSFRFNTKNYIEDYPDVKESGINPLIHYIKFGKSEGRSISNAKN